jgi:hypothetical protein
VIRERVTDVSEHHALNDTHRTVSVPHDVKNMYTMTDSIYTVFLPTHNAGGLYMKMFPVAPGSLVPSLWDSIFW